MASSIRDRDVRFFVEDGYLIRTVTGGGGRLVVATRTAVREGGVRAGRPRGRGDAGAGGGDDARRVLARQRRCPSRR